MTASQTGRALRPRFMVPDYAIRVPYPPPPPPPSTKALTSGTTSKASDTSPEPPVAISVPYGQTRHDLLARRKASGYAVNVESVHRRTQLQLVSEALLYIEQAESIRWFRDRHGDIILPLPNRDRSITMSPSGSIKIQYKDTNADKNKINRFIRRKIEEAGWIMIGAVAGALVLNHIFTLPPLARLLIISCLGLHALWTLASIHDEAKDYSVGIKTIVQRLITADDRTEVRAIVAFATKELKILEQQVPEEMLQEPGERRTWAC